MSVWLIPFSLFVLASVGLSKPAQAQEPEYLDHFKYVKPRDLQLRISRGFGFESETAAARYLREIMQTMGLPSRISIEENSGETTNALARTDCTSGVQLIYYNKGYLDGLRRADTGAARDWIGLTVLAHEIGHHLAGHSARLRFAQCQPDDDSRNAQMRILLERLRCEGFAKFELEADEFAAGRMKAMGAPLDKVLKAYDHLGNSSCPRSVHPSRQARQDVIRRVYGASAGAEFVAASEPAERAVDGFQLIRNIDFDGNDIYRFGDLDLEGCAKACLENDKCAGFNYDDVRRWCYIKDKLEDQRSGIPGVSGIRKVPANVSLAFSPLRSGAPDVIEILPDTDFYGNDYDKLISVTSERCKLSCAGDQNCKAFTWAPSSTRPEIGNCYLKSAAPIKTRYVGLISGLRRTASYRRRAQQNAVQLLPNTDFYGNDYQKLEKVGVSTCQLSCAGDGQCRAFTWAPFTTDPKLGNCYLKDQANDSSAKVGLVSGLKR